MRKSEHFVATPLRRQWPEIGNATAGSVACSGSKDSSLRSRSHPAGFAQIGSAVMKVRMVDARGDVLVIDDRGAVVEHTGQRTPGLTLDLVRCSYGLLGIIFEVEFETVPLVPLENRFVWLPIADAFDESRPTGSGITVPSIDQIFDNADAVLAFLQPYKGRMLVERRTIVTDGRAPSAADDVKRAMRDWIWEWGASETTTWCTGLADLLSGELKGALSALLGTALESLRAGSIENPLLRMPKPPGWTDQLSLAIVEREIVKLAGALRDSAQAEDATLSALLLALFDRVPGPFFEMLLRGYRAHRSDSLVDFTHRRATFFDFTFWAFPQRLWSTLVPEYIEFCRHYSATHGMYRPALFTEVYFICQDTRSHLSFSPKEPVFTLDMVDNRPTDPRWKAMNQAFNEWAVERGGRPLLNQTKELQAMPGVVARAYGEKWAEYSTAVWTANPPTDDSRDGRFVSRYFKALLDPR